MAEHQDIFSLHATESDYSEVIQHPRKESYLPFLALDDESI